MPETQEHYRHLFSKLTKAVAYCRVLNDGPPPHDFVYLEVNQAFERLTGLKDVVGKKVSEVIPNLRETDRELLDIYSEVASTGQPRQFDRYVRALDQWFSVSAFCPKKDHFLAVFEVSSDHPLAKTLRESQALASSVVSSMAEGVIVLDATGCIVTSNGVGERILGLSRKQALGLTASEFRTVYEDGTPFPAEKHPAMRVLQTGTPVTDEVMGVHRPDGSLVWISVNAGPIFYGEGNRPDAVVTTFTDITARKQAEAEREQYFNLFQVSADLMVIADPNGAFLKTNPACTQLLGYSEAELLAKPFIDFVHPDDRQSTLDEMAHQIQHGLSINFKNRYVCKDGSLRWLSWHAHYEPAEGTTYATARDFTERKQAQELLQRERTRYLSILRISQDGIHLLDERGDLIEASESFLRMLGYDRQALGRLNVLDWDTVTPADAMLADLQEVLVKPRLFLTRYRRQDGSEFDVEVNAGPVVLDGQHYVLASARDISARKELERVLAARQAELEERVQTALTDLRKKDQMLMTQSRQAAMGEMIGNIAHQWRQPLCALGLVLANLRDAWRRGRLDEPTMDRVVGDANNLIREMSTTINDFRDFVKPNKEKTAFSALAQIREAVRLVEASYSHAGISVEIESGADVTAFGVPNEYSQVVLNLLSNARQAIEASEVAHGQVTLRLGSQDGSACLVVIDNGDGIPEANLDKIFEPYFTTRVGGTGIGLFLSRQIIERSFGGRLEVRNVEGGAEFTVLTPLV